MYVSQHPLHRVHPTQQNFHAILANFSLCFIHTNLFSLPVVTWWHPHPQNIISLDIPEFWFEGSDGVGDLDIYIYIYIHTCKSMVVHGIQPAASAPSTPPGYKACSNSSGFNATSSGDLHTKKNYLKRCHHHASVTAALAQEAWALVHGRVSVEVYRNCCWVAWSVMLVGNW